METIVVKEVVEKLKSLDLATYPVDNILSLFKTVDTEIPIVVATINPGRIIVRGQLYDSTANYTVASRHSYKPQSKNNDYQRASTPSQTMFYGSITALENVENEPIARQTIITEIGKIIHEASVTEESYVFSVWEVIEEIELVAVIQSQKYSTPLNLLKNFKIIMS